MNTRFGTAAAGVAAAALVATSVIGLSSASAEVFDIAGPISGGLTVNGNAATLPDGSSVMGTFDSDSGNLDLAVDIPEGTLNASVGGNEAVVSYTLSSAGGLIGTVDSSGAVSASAVFQLDLTQAVVGGSPISLAPCSFGPIQMSFTGTLTETELTLSDPGFVIPAATEGCGGAGIIGIINGQVAGENNSADLTVEIGADVPATTTSTTMVEETTTTTAVDGTTSTTLNGPTNPGTPGTSGGGVGPATGAKPVAGSANYTG